MLRIVGLGILLLSVPAYGVKFNVINNMPREKAHFRIEHAACGSQDYYFNPLSTSEFVPKTIPATLFSKEKSCCVKKLIYVLPNLREIELATDASLNELGRKNGTGDNCSGYFTIELAPNGVATIR